MRKSFTEHLRGLKRRHGFHLKEPEISALYNYLRGWEDAIYDGTRSENINGFRYWLCCKYLLPDSQNWDTILLDLSDQDELRAFEMFFDELDDYLKDRDSIGDDAIRNRFVSLHNQIYKKA